MSNLKKTAAAFVAVAFATGAANAQDLTAEGNDDLLHNIYADVDADREVVFETVLATAQARLESRFAKIENNLFDESDVANPPHYMVVASN